MSVRELFHSEAGSLTEKQGGSAVKRPSGCTQHTVLARVVVQVLWQSEPKDQPRVSRNS